MSSRFADDGHCFVCGSLNDRGLHVQFRATGDGSVRAGFVLDKSYQGYRDIVHGGILAALLDEACVKAVLSNGSRAVTAEMVLRFKQPLPAGEAAVVEARITSTRGKFFAAGAEIRKETGGLVASCTAKLVRCED